jgi:hypothetical protein
MKTKPKKPNFIYDYLKARKNRVTNLIQLATIDNNDTKIMQGNYLLNQIEQRIESRFKPQFN